MAPPDTPEVRRDKDEIRAIIRAHRDLGPEYEDELVDQLYHALGPRPPAPAPPEEPWRRHRHRGRARGFLFMALVFSVPLLAIAGQTAGLPGDLAVLALDAWAIYRGTGGRG